MRALKQRLRAGLAVIAVGAASATSALILVLLPPPAAAAIDCWVDAEHPVTGDQRPGNDPAVAPVRQALHTVNAVLHAQRELHELPRTRLRSSWQVGGLWDGPARSGRLLVRISRHRGHPFHAIADSVSRQGGHRFTLIADGVSA